MEKPEQPDHYESLGVDPQASVQEIGRAFRKLAKLHHPDKQAPGTCDGAEEFCKVREAQEELCDESRRRDYDRIYPRIRLQWVQYRKDIDAQQSRETLEKDEAEKTRRKAAEWAAKKEAEAEKVRRAVEEERLAALRARNEREAEERSREAGRRAREQQERQARERLQNDEKKKAREEQVAKERLRNEKERSAEERSRKAAQQHRKQQEKEAKERLVQIQAIERQDTIARNWMTMREQAESRQVRPAEVQSQGSNEVANEASAKCVHPQVGWPRKNGPARCHFCDKQCGKYSFRCPDCNVAACVTCKKQYVSY